jgi:hypothetical protein
VSLSLLRHEVAGDPAGRRCSTRFASGSTTE